MTHNCNLRLRTVRTKVTVHPYVSNHLYNIAKLMSISPYFCLGHLTSFMTCLNSALNFLRQ